MYALTAAAAAALNSHHRRVVFYALVGVLWGWAVAGVAFLPYGILLLLVGNPRAYIPAGVVGAAGTLTPMVALDRLFYGKWTVSLALPAVMHSAQPCLSKWIAASESIMQSRCKVWCMQLPDIKQPCLAVACMTAHFVTNQ